MKKIIQFIFFICTLQFAVTPYAADVIVVAGTPGSGEFYVKAVDFVDVGGVEIELQYDSSTMVNPRITQGDMLASTMFVPNTKFRSNAVKIAAMSLAAIKGSGDLLKLNFDLKGQSSGVVTVTRKILSSSSGTSINTSAGSVGTVGTIPVGSVGTGSIVGSGSTTDSSTVTTAGGTSVTGSGYAGSGTLTLSGTYGSEAASSSVGGTSTGSSSVGVAGISIGGTTLPQDQMASAERRPDYQPVVTDLRKDMNLPLGGSAGSAVTGKQGSTQDKQADDKSIAYRAVSQLFKDFKGEREPKALISLFASLEIPDFRQEPAIAFSDGITPMKISLRFKPLGNESPKFIVQGANVQQLRSEGENYTWIIEAVPKKSVTEGKITVIDGKRIVEFPLTVTPQVNSALKGTAKPSDSDFALYLAKPSRYDLNKDGKFDYVDDYIYTANYIVALNIKPEKLQPKTVKEAPKGEKKSAEQVKPVAPAQKGLEKPADKPVEKTDSSSTKPVTKKPVKKAGKSQDKKQKDKDKKQEKPKEAN